jgi:arylsulfatase
MNADQKRLFERQMETFAGFAEQTDYEVGRLVEQLKAIGELDNTIFFYIVGDNGSSAEGGPEGTYNEMMALNGIVGTADQMMDHIDDWGGPTTFPHFAIGWAWAGDTPFQWTKQVASHFGGTRNGMVLHWPQGIKSRGEIRSQFSHVIDVAPTVLEAARLPEPKRVNGVDQYPMDGVSMLYSVDDAKAANRRTTQYFDPCVDRSADVSRGAALDLRSAVDRAEARHRTAVEERPAAAPTDGRRPPGLPRAARRRPARP